MSLFPNNDIKKQVQALLCPICKCGLEGIPTFDPRNSNIERFYLTCAQTLNHYAVQGWWDITEAPIVIRLEQEWLVIVSDQIQYSIAKNKGSNSIRTSVSLAQVNGDGNLIDDLKKTVTIDADCFDFSTYDEKAMIKRLKTLLFYQ